jgi:AcrR family transcriptional regulator
MAESPKFLRRKAARPQEIVEAAANVFAEKGFAASKLEEIGKRAGVSKGTLYLYYPTKEALFEEVVKAYAASTLKDLRDSIARIEGDIFDRLPEVFAAALQEIGGSRIPAVAKMVIAESGNFPELARSWHREVITPMLTSLAALIRKEQKAGRVAAGPPELYAVCMASPFVTSMLFREVFGQAAMPAELLRQLPEIHARLMTQGMSIPAVKLTNRSRKQTASPQRRNSKSPDFQE